MNGRSIIIYETGHAGSQKAAGSTSPLSHITCVTRAPFLHHFPGLASLYLKKCPCLHAHFPPCQPCPSKLPVPVGVFWAQLIYASRRLSNAALPTCLTCAKIAGCDVSDKYIYTVHSSNMCVESEYTQQVFSNIRVPLA